MYFLDLLGTLAFAVTGAYKAKKEKLHILGVVFLGVITAVGGGTIRDLIIGRTPLFYLEDVNYLFIAIIGSILTYLAPTFFKKQYSLFRFIDSIGLSAFVIIGVTIPYGFLSFNNYILSLMVCVFLGVLTGFGGGVIRDAIMGDVPLSLKGGSNYATAAFFGALIFYLLIGFGFGIAASVSFLVTLYFREIVSKFGILKKIIKK
jgi:uncharacterized membrane protein YeiH